MMEDLLSEVRAKFEKGQLNPNTVAARLLSITLATGQPLPDANLQAEFAVTFLAGDVFWPALPATVLIQERTSNG